MSKVEGVIQNPNSAGTADAARRLATTNAERIATYTSAHIVQEVEKAAKTGAVDCKYNAKEMSPLAVEGTVKKLRDAGFKVSVAKLYGPGVQFIVEW